MLLRISLPRISLLRTALLLTISLLALTASEGPGKVLFLLEKGFNRGEHYTAYHGLKVLGYQVDIASIAGGPVLLSKEGKVDERGRDVADSISLAAVKPEDYRALVIPGGYSPGFLEKDPQALAIADHFGSGGKLTAAICHGPRLLMHTGLLSDRVATGLFTLSDECADLWVQGNFGNYIDRNLVTDGNLITARYPNDTKRFTLAVAQALEAEGGAAVPALAGQVLVVAPELDSPHARWVVDSALEVFGLNVGVTPSVKDWTAVEAGLVVTVDTEADPALSAPSVAISGGSAEAIIAGVLAAAAGRLQAPAVVEEPATAVIALRPGFDESVVLALKPQLERLGHRVSIRSFEAGWVKGLQGFPIEADGSYGDDTGIADGALIIAPGGLWPRWDPKARQVDQPTWLEEQAVVDGDRLDWLLARHAKGDHLILTGFDALDFGRQDDTKGLKVATSDQAVWSFGKGRASYSKELLVETKPKLWTAKGATAIGPMLDLVDSLSK